jgi:hypothetical protein
MRTDPAVIGGKAASPSGDDSLSRTQVIALLLAAVPLLLLLQPYQWISAPGFRLQQAWPLDGDADIPGGSILRVFACTVLLALLANGPLRRGRGEGSPGCWPCARR